MTGARLGDRIQGYSFWVDGTSGKPIQTGVSPDRTSDGAIMFGYAFEREPTRDRLDTSVAPYRHPQSFYFSGYPLAPADAPIVSQNYTDFVMVRPNPRTTWDQVAHLDVKKLPRCQLFNPPPSLVGAAAKRAPTWGDLRRK